MTLAEPEMRGLLDAGVAVPPKPQRRVENVPLPGRLSLTKPHGREVRTVVKFRVSR